MTFSATTPPGFRVAISPMFGITLFVGDERMRHLMPDKAKAFPSLEAAVDGALESLRTMVWGEKGEPRLVEIFDETGRVFSKIQVNARGQAVSDGTPLRRG